VERFAGMGWSMGGQYAAAVGHFLRQRVTRVAIVAPSRPSAVRPARRTRARAGRRRRYPWRRIPYVRADVTRSLAATRRCRRGIPRMGTPVGLRT
jgi:pimeloyl-ACP methyl ester carboxylesterase